MTRLIGVIVPCSRCHKRLARWLVFNRPLCNGCAKETS